MGNPSLPEEVRDQLKKQAQVAGLPYATILEQHIYDLQGLESVLEAELRDADQALMANNPQSEPLLRCKVAEVRHKLEACQAQIAAYQKEKTTQAG